MSAKAVISISVDDGGWRAESAQLPELCLSAPTLGELLVNLRRGVDLMVDGAIARAINEIRTGGHASRPG